jgi:hypothetical protein
MKQFCEDVLKFLCSEYNDSYQFSIEYHKTLNSEKDTVELVIEVSPRYKIKLNSDTMFYIFGWYHDGVYIEERRQYRWQKELIDAIDGS